ncbi:hypothetical protein FOA52_010624 [Chlamydomonas sp. UWO 241]|nr:hypothetical protein FOA52_010624 [Chlamydomonas sp. UWO 241]
MPTVVFIIIAVLCVAHGQVAQAYSSGGGGRRSLAKFPLYSRGGAYEYILTAEDRDNGISHLGAATRLRAKLSALAKGGKLKVATIGGSITAGQGAVDAPNWPQYLFGFLEDTYGKDVATGHNGAMAGTVSSYMSACHNMHVPKDSDIIFVEYSVNDEAHPMPLFNNDMRRAYERLIRKLLSYPNQPAVVLLHTYTWMQGHHNTAGTYWSGAEREFSELSLYYALPALSLKSAVYHRMRVGEEGFQVAAPRNSNETALKDKAFYYDNVHPDGRTGCRVIAELAIHLISSVLAQVKSSEPAALQPQPLPPPMIPGNHESANDKCFIGGSFVATVQEPHEGWEWANEAKNSLRPKWGFISTTAGSALKVKVDTRASASASADNSDVMVQIAYLQSYENMGKASITCEGGCACPASTPIDGHNPGDKTSQTHLHAFYVSQAEDCIIVFTVLPETGSGQHKVKLTGVIISEESGKQAEWRNTRAVEYVADISARGADGVFEVMNHAR